MDDDVVRIDQHPVGCRESFDSNALAKLLLDLVGKLNGHGRDLTRRATRGDHHMVGDVRFSGQRDGNDFLGLVVIKRLEDETVKVFDVDDLHKLVLQSLDDDRAQEVVTIPLVGKSNIADHMVVATGRSTRQVASMAVKLADKIKQRFNRNVRIEGLPAGDWVLIDADDVIVHIFRPEVRNFYNLERMWAFGDESSANATARG